MFPDEQSEFRDPIIGELIFYSKTEFLSKNPACSQAGFFYDFLHSFLLL